MTELSKEVHHEENTDPREDDLGRRKYLRVIVRTLVVRKHMGTHCANTLTEGGGESVEDVNGRRKPLGESLIAALRLIQLVGLPLKYGEDCIRRAAAFDLLREWVGGKFFSGLPLVLLQSFIEDQLEIWSS